MIIVHVSKELKIWLEEQRQLSTKDSSKDGQFTWFSLTAFENLYERKRSRIFWDVRFTVMSGIACILYLIIQSSVQATFTATNWMLSAHALEETNKKADILPSKSIGIALSWNFMVEWEIKKISYQHLSITYLHFQARTWQPSTSC